MIQFEPTIFHLADLTATSIAETNSGAKACQQFPPFLSLGLFAQHGPFPCGVTRFFPK
jgi:hypothetical protein